MASPVYDARPGASRSGAGGAFAVSAGLSLLFFLSYCHAGINLSDEGVWVSAAVLMKQGVSPYTDYLSPHLSLLPWIYAGLFAMTGPSLLAVRQLCAVLKALAVGLALLGGRKIREGPGKVGWIPALAMTMAAGPWHKTPAVLGQALTAWLLLRWLESPTMARGALLGLCQGLLMTVDASNNVWPVLGTALALGLIGSLVTGGDRRKRGLGMGGAWLAGMTLGLLPLGVVLWPRRNAFSLQVPEGPLPFDPAWVIESSWLGFPDLLSLALRGEGRAHDLAFGMALDLCVIVAGLGMWRGISGLGGKSGENAPGEERRGRMCLGLACLAVLALVKIGIRADPPHLFQNAHPFWMLGIFLVGERGWVPSLKWRGGGRLLSSLALGVALLSVSVVSFTHPDPYYIGSVMALRQAEVPLSLPGTGLWDRGPLVEDLTRATEYLKSHAAKGDTLFALPTCPLFHFLTGMRNGIRPIWVAPPQKGEFQMTRAYVWEVENRRPDWVIWDRGPFIHGDSTTLARKAEALVEVLERRYRVEATFGPFQIRRRLTGEEGGR